MAKPDRDEWVALLAERLAEAMYHKCGRELSAPINFCSSRPFFRYIAGHKLNDKEAGIFSLAYRQRWWSLSTHEN